MALVLKDRVKVTSTTTGTGTFTLGSAALGYDDFSVIGDGNTTYYTISIAADWEVGIGTYTASGTTLSRDTVLASSNSGSLVNFGAGTKDVFVTYSATKSVNLDANNDLDIDSNTLFVDSSTNRVGIGTSSPINELHVIGTDGDTRIRLEDTTGFTSLDMVAADGSSNVINFGDASDINIGRIEYDHLVDAMVIDTNNTERIRITSAGGVSFGSSGTAYGTQDQVLVSNGNAVPSWNTLDLGYMPSAAFKKSVRVATTANITLSNVTTVVDGVTLVNGDRILVKNQTTDSQNGIYIVSTSGAWTRSTDANTSDKIAAAIVVVDLGTQGGLTYTNTFKASDTLDTTAMYWLIVSSTGYYRTNSTIAGGNDTTVRSVLGVAVTLAAGTVYDIEGAFYLNKTAGTTSSFINFSLQAAGGLTANNLQVHVLTRFGTGVVAVESVDNYGLITALNTNLACYAASTTAVVGLIVQYKGTISVNAAGTLAPSYSQSAASGGAWTANIGNYMKIVPLGSAGVIDIGPWA